MDAFRACYWIRHACSPLPQLLTDSTLSQMLQQIFCSEAELQAFHFVFGVSARSAYAYASKYDVSVPNVPDNMLGEASALGPLH